MVDTVIELVVLLCKFVCWARRSGFVFTIWFFFLKFQPTARTKWNDPFSERWMTLSVAHIKGSQQIWEKTVVASLTVVSPLSEQ